MAVPDPSIPMLHAPSRPSLPVFAGIVMALIGALLSWRAGQLDRDRHISDRQAEVQAELSDFRARLETQVYSGIALGRGLAAQLVIHEGMSAQDFAAIAGELKRNHPYIRYLSLAPGFVVRDIQPRQGNEAALGVNLLTDPQQKPAMLRAINLDDAVLAGPFVLGDDETVLIGRIPLWVDKQGVPRLWGAVGIALDYDRLMADAGIRKLEKDLLISIRGRDASGPGGERIRGERLAVPSEAIKVPVFLPGGSWLISATPREGWYRRPWWLTGTGVFGLLASLVAGLAVMRILQDRQRIRLLAGLDALTNLPNRRWALDHLARLIARGRRSGDHFALMSFDLDGFKPINDTYGHAAGDLLLAEIARRLSESLRPGDLVARMGGDEFLVMIGTERDVAQQWLRGMATRVQSAVSRPVNIDNHWVVVGASIGIACFPEDGDDAEVLLRRADEAMYRAKRESIDGLEFARTTGPVPTLA